MQCQCRGIGIIKLLSFTSLAIPIPWADGVDYIFSGGITATGAVMIAWPGVSGANGFAAASS